jgi:hypothetical protein
MGNLGWGFSTLVVLHEAVAVGFVEKRFLYFELSQRKNRRRTITGLGGISGISTYPVPHS